MWTSYLTIDHVGPTFSIQPICWQQYTSREEFHWRLSGVSVKTPIGSLTRDYVHYCYPSGNFHTPQFLSACLWSQQRFLRQNMSQLSQEILYHLSQVQKHPFWWLSTRLTTIESHLWQSIKASWISWSWTQSEISPCEDHKVVYPSRKIFCIST